MINEIKTWLEGEPGILNEIRLSHVPGRFTAHFIIFDAASPHARLLRIVEDNSDLITALRDGLFKAKL